MLNKIVMALMIWGLVLQPLTAAVPDLMPADSSSTAVVVIDSVDAMASHHAINDDDAPPCHDMVDEVQNSMDCADCEDGCASSVCASSCSFSSPAVVNQLMPKLAQHTPVRAVGSNDALIQGRLTRIFHPPKHA